MCKHSARPIITRTRILDNNGLTGHGKLHILQWVRKISKTHYQGNYQDGERWWISQHYINSNPNQYRLRRQCHRDCYQLITTQNEYYKGIKAVFPLLGPCQMDRPGTGKWQFQFVDGKSLTDKALEDTKGLLNYDVVTVERDTGSKQFLRTTGRRCYC